jgi:IS30 family transposase
MQHLTSQMQHEIEWRRCKVWELLSQGNSEREIGGILQVHHTTVHRDLMYLRKQAQENLKTHIQHTMPQEYQKYIRSV